MTRRDRLLLPPATSDTGDVASDRYAPLIEGTGSATAEKLVEPQRVSRERQLAAAAGQPVRRGVLAHRRSASGRRRRNHVAGETRLAVDAANGVGSVLDFTKFVFMNTDTSVHLHRPPRRTKFACFYIERLQY